MFFTVNTNFYQLTKKKKGSQSEAYDTDESATGSRRSGESVREQCTGQQAENLRAPVHFAVTTCIYVVAHETPCRGLNYALKYSTKHVGTLLREKFIILFEF